MMDQLYLMIIFLMVIGIKYSRTTALLFPRFPNMNLLSLFSSNRDSRSTPCAKCLEITSVAISARFIKWQWIWHRRKFCSHRQWRRMIYFSHLKYWRTKHAAYVVCKLTVQSCVPDTNLDDDDEVSWGLGLVRSHPHCLPVNPSLKWDSIGLTLARGGE